ncbi:MFS transporter [Pseudomonas sp. Rh2]|uniref:MFS transporter n=1 Tax=Pseudomonas TaxID=286 RepID=UPI000418555A|nr:MFS transporter [Pseudomonas taiwanensis]
MGTPLSAAQTAPRAGVAQGLIMVLTGFLPILAIVSLAPAVPTLIEHFAPVAHAQVLIPLMITAPGLVIAFVAPFAGLLADRLGRRRLLIGATFLFGVCGTMPLWCQSLTLIFASRLGVGLAEAVVLTLANTMLVNYFNVRRRRFWLALQGFVGPSLAAAVIASSGYLTALVWNGAFWIYSIAFPLCLAMKVWMFEPDADTRHDDEPLIDDSVFPWLRMATICLTTFVIAVVYYVYTINAGTAFHALDGASPQRIGMLMSLASLAVPLGALLFGWVSSRTTPERVLTVTLALIGAGMIAIGQARNPMVMGVGAVVQQVGAGMAVSAMIFWVASLVGPAHRGRAMGAWSSAFFAGMFVSPLFVNLLRVQAEGNIMVPFSVFGGVALVLAAAIFAYSLSGHGHALRKLPA